jgi:hypothetical protein
MSTFEPLTPAELDVLIWHAKDFKVTEIKDHKIKSYHTPKNQVCSAKKKLKVRTVPAAIVRAYQLRLINLDDIKIEDLKNHPPRTKKAKPKIE